MVKADIGNGEYVYLDGYLHQLLSDLKVAVLTRNTSSVMVIDGRSGMGKTTLGIQCCKFLDNSFDLEKVFYDPDDFLRGLAVAKKGDALLFDEAMLISNRSALSQINRMVVQAMSMIRSKQIFVFFAVNSIFDLDRNLALHRADLLLHVYGDNLIDRGAFGAFFKAKNQECKIKLLYLLGRKMYSYSKPKANFFGSFVSKFLVDEAEYERRKQEAVNKFLRVGSKNTHKRDKYLLKMIDYMKDKLNLTVEAIAEIMDCSKKTVYNIQDGRDIPSE